MVTPRQTCRRAPRRRHSLLSALSRAVAIVLQGHVFNRHWRRLPSVLFRTAPEEQVRRRRRRRIQAATSIIIRPFRRPFSDVQLRRGRPTGQRRLYTSSSGGSSFHRTFVFVSCAALQESAGALDENVAGWNCSDVCGFKTVWLCAWVSSRLALQRASLAIQSGPERGSSTRRPAEVEKRARERIEYRTTSTFSGRR